MLSLLKEINEIDASLFEMGGLNLTGFSMVDYKNLNTMSLLSDIFPENTQSRIKVIFAFCLEEKRNVILKVCRLN